MILCGSRRECHAGPDEVAPSPGLTCGGSLNSDRAQAKPSTVRCSCQASGRRECSRSFARMPPIEDRLDDIRREIAEADEPSEIRPADTFPRGECGERNGFALGEYRVEPARPEEQPDQSRVRFRRSKRIGAVDHHSGLPHGAAQPHPRTESRFRRRSGLAMVQQLHRVVH